MWILWTLSVASPAAPPIYAVAPTSHMHHHVEMALTFDDLPCHGPLVPGQTRMSVVRQIIQVLQAHHVPPVYGFVNGRCVAGDPAQRAVLQAWLDAGNYLGNHTFQHSDLSVVGSARFNADIDRNEPLLEELAAHQGEPWKLFRYPFLHEGYPYAEREAVRHHLLARGYRVAEVTVDFSDWAWNQPYARCVARKDAMAIAALRNNYIQDARMLLYWSLETARELYHRPIPHVLLLHVGVFGAEMLEPLLAMYESNGVRFITLAQALADPAYDVDSGMQGGKLLDQMVTAHHQKPPVYSVEPLDLLDALCR